MYVNNSDRRSTCAYFHNHATYICSCGIIVGTCLCTDEKKEEIHFDNCWHDKTVKHADLTKLKVNAAELKRIRLEAKKSGW